MESTNAKYLTPADVEQEYHIPQSTQAVWRCTNRYGWKNIAIKRGSRILYARVDLENWMDGRKG